jgi:hypothetical protein
MSGRTFGFQASWDETLRKLTAGLDIDGTQLRQSVSVAESMNQQLEEFVNRSVVTYINDSGDVTIGGALSAASFSGPLTGNADTATALATARAINGVDFDGTAAITVTAAAGTLTGVTLNSGVTASSLTSVGTLASLTVTGDATFDTSTLKVDSANNRVGIGTTSPNKALDVVSSGTTELSIRSTTSAGDSALLFGNVDDTYQASLLYDASAQSLLIRSYNNTTVLDVSTADVDVTTGHLNVISNTGAPTMSFGEWSSGSNYLAIESPSMYILMGQNAENDAGYIRTKGTGALYLGSNASNDLTIANGGGITAVGAFTAGGNIATTSGNITASGAVYSSSWFRSYGSTGWYNQTYAIGLRATDSTWIRTYGSTKGLLTGPLAATLSAITSTSGFNYVMRNAAYTQFAYYTSSRKLKENIVNVAPSDSGAWMDALQPVSFIGRWLGEGDEPAVEKAWREADVQVGFVAEDVLGNDITAQFSQVTSEGDELVATGWKWECVIAASVAEIKSLRTRIAALEAV